MSTKPILDEDVTVHVTNIGGIDETSVEFSPGVTVLAGRNATNRTSFLQAVMAGLGSENVPLKADADEGHVELSVGEETYTRTARRDGGTLSTGGDPYLDDPELAELFAFLLSTNEARLAVERGDDLRELIMRPIDTEAIQAEIRETEARRDDLRAELEDLDELERTLPDLEEKRTRLQSEMAETRDALAAKRREIEAADADLEESKEESAALDETFDELNDARSELESVRFKLETKQESIEALETEREELEAELDELSEVSQTELEDLESRIDRLRDRDSTMETELNELGNVIRFNENRLQSERGPMLQTGDEDAGADPVTDKLLADAETVTCWTCGTEVQTTQIEATLDRLREFRQQKLAERDELQDELDALTDEVREIEAARDRRETVERRLDDVDDEIRDQEETIETLRDRRDGLQDEIDELEAAVDELEDDAYSEVLDLHREANELEFELRELEDDLAAVDEEIETVEERLADREEIEVDLESTQSELADLRTRIEQIEAQAVEQFNDHMEEVLARLEYGNIERIWIERVERSEREGRRTVDRRSFDLHVVRSTEDGVAYEDTIHHLSESEREVTGLVFALAGYLVHDVHETCPFILLDSLETIDADRIAALVDYVQEYTDYLVVALLPEDAEALDDSYRRVTAI